MGGVTGAGIRTKSSLSLRNLHPTPEGCTWADVLVPNSESTYLVLANALEPMTWHTLQVPLSPLLTPRIQPQEGIIPGG